VSDPFEIRSVTIPGLGNRAHVVLSGNEALIVDVPRVPRPILDLVGDADARVRWIAETHVHNDYLSGGLEVQVAAGGELVGPADAGYAFPFTGLSEGDDLELGDVHVRPIATPGHTPEHLSYLVLSDDRPVAVLSGGSLLIGNAGRTDLLGPHLADGLGRAQYRSLHRLAMLPDDVRVFPTHGGGSFCTTGPAPEGVSSTIGAERASNPYLRAPDEDAFLASRRLDRYPYPRYYAAMGPANRRGVRSVLEIPPPPRMPAEVALLVANGAVVVDARDRWSFMGGHIPGSLGVSLDEGFAGFVGSVVEVGTPLVLLGSHRVEVSEASARLARIGYEVVGYMPGGIEAWEAEGRPVTSTRGIDIWDFDDALRQRADEIAVLDVRSPWEWDEGTLPGSLTIHLGELGDRIDEVPRDREVWVLCAAGRRAEVAASLLEREGITAGAVLVGGVPDLLEIRQEARGSVASRTG
jgi:rhodanese-related sulfurtransferase/glyoxylase-like metal-dependent hydrolase (beta-lactamase superfamily II)